MILLVNQHVVPIFTDIANAFAETEEQIVLFTGHVEKGAQPISRKIKIVSSFRYQRKSTLTRLTSWFLFTAHYTLYLIFCKKPSRILVVTNPPLAPLITSFVSSWRKFSYYILLYDLYPEALSQVGLMTERKFIYRQWQRLNYRLFKNAIKVFTLSESMKKAASPYMYDGGGKVKVIHNWADITYIQPLSKVENPFLKSHNLEGKIVVLYSGNMGLTHDLESMINAAEQLKEEERFSFVLIGDGGKRSKLQKMAQSKGLKNVLFLPYQNEKQFPFAMAAADIGVVTLGVGAEGISVPSKTYINLAAGACILAIAPQVSELSRLIEEHHTGIVCEPGNVSAVTTALILLLNNPEVLSRYKSDALSASRLYTSANAKEYIREMIN